MTDASNNIEDGGQSAILPESIVEKLCCWLCEIALAAMVLTTSAEVIARLFHFSFQGIDEIGGYLLVALTFLSLPVSLIGGAFHQVEFVQSRFGPRVRALSGIVFTLLAMVFASVIAWQGIRLVTRSHAAEVTAPSLLATPLWIPQSLIVIGMAALLFSLLRVLMRQARDFMNPSENDRA